MSESVDLRQVQDVKLVELHDMSLSEDAKAFKDATEAVAKLFEIENEIGKTADSYVLRKQELDLEEAKLALERDRLNADIEQNIRADKSEKRSRILKWVGLGLTGVTLIVDIFGKLVVLGTDECSPRALSRSARDWLESKSKPKVNL